MSYISDDIFAGSIVGIILGLPIFAGIGILAIPFLIISGITGVPMHIIIQNLLVFVIAMLIIGLLSRYQIIENVIVGLMIGLAAYKYWGWHSLVCVLIGATAVGLLFFISNIKIGFVIKTLLFSVAVTFLVFMSLYSDVGLFPMSDKIWKIAFVIIFFLENLFIRCSMALDNGFLIDGYVKKHQNIKYHYDVRQVGAGSAAGLSAYNTNQANDSKISEINNSVKAMNEDILNRREDEGDEESPAYLMERVYLFSQKNSFWDGKLIDNMEEKVYTNLRDFIDKDYLIIPHVAFREIFWWGEWKSDWTLTNRVTKMHFDFGIYNKDMQPILFIEIWGKEHRENPVVVELDQFKAEVMKRCGMKLIIMDCSESMTDQEIREKLIYCIKSEIPDRRSYAAYCPQCKSQGKNILMEIRQNKSNGEYFYGCSTYEKGRKDNCPTLALEKVPPLYYGIPTIKGNN